MAAETLKAISGANKNESEGQKDTGKRSGRDEAQPPVYLMSVKMKKGES